MAEICIPFDQGGLGFRDLKLFNLALLAKQLWRLLYFPSSLLARILKGRYYRNSTPFEVERSNLPSYGWNSITTARELLKKGLRRTIGNGEDTLVWQDPWIPATMPRPPIDYGVYRDPFLRVSDLVNPVSSEWLIDKMSSIMDPEDIELARTIKLSRINRKDGFCWTLTKSGLYSVKSGYTLAMQLKEDLNPCQINQPSTDAIKSKIWTLKTSRKIKHFLWQAVTGCTSVYSRLVDRHCGSNRSCPRCG